MKKTLRQFIEESQNIHGDKYDYSKVEYKNTHTKVCIICPKHGEFWQNPHDHIKGCGCPKCNVEIQSKAQILGKNEFIKRAQNIWGNKFDYSKVNYINFRTKVCIICPEHGEFWQTPSSHLKGINYFEKNNAWTCSRKKKTNEDFINESKQVHGDKYDYSKVEYVNPQTKVCIICHKHGEFWQTPINHLCGKGCRKCGYENLTKQNNCSKDVFITKCQMKYGDKYDYSKVEYVNNKTKVCIICPEHGEFWQTPSRHLKGGECKKCIIDKQKKQKKIFYEKFILKSKSIHNDKYDYSKVEYVKANTKVCIICPEHGEFWQIPYNHLRGQGCPICKNNNTQNRNTLTTKEFIEKAKKIWGDKFDYSKVDYVNAKTKVCIICPEHGEFWQTPTNHLSGYDCLECSKHGYTKESMIKKILLETFQEEEIIYQTHLNWLGRQTFDFYFPKYRIAIEYQGQQHFMPVKLFGGKKSFEYTRKMDIKKNMLAISNNVKILYFSFIKIDIGDFPYDVIFDVNILIDKIKKIIDKNE